MLELYPSEFSDIVATCRSKYPLFKQNSAFYRVMEEVKLDSECAHKRLLNPSKENSAFKMLYNFERTMAKLDHEYG